MDAVALLESKLNVSMLLEHYGFNARQDGEFIRSACRIHGGSEPTAFVINATSGLWYCHTGGCGGGDAYTLVQRMEECTFRESVAILADLHGIDIENMEVYERQEPYIKEGKEWLESMKSLSELEAPPEYELDAELRGVKKFRDFNEETLDHFDLSYATEATLTKADGGTYTVRDRLIIPIIQDDRKVGVSIRKTKAKDFPKWLHQPRGIKTSNMLYNYDATQGKTSVTIVEGVFDVWAYHEIGITAVATFGAHLTHNQYRLLMRTGADLVLSYDGDKAGQQATQEALKTFYHKANVECVAFSEDEDPGSVTRDDLKLKYESRRKT